MLISTKQIYSGAFLKLNIEKVELPNGKQCELEILHHPGGVAIVAMNAQREICLLRQYRHAAKGWLWEIPAGKIEKNEAVEMTAKRELTEEAGVRARSWLLLGKTISSPGVFTEEVLLYLAEDLSPCEQELEDEEVLEVHWFSLDEIVAMIRNGVIYDAKTLIALFYLQLHLCTD